MTTTSMPAIDVGRLRSVLADSGCDVAALVGATREPLGSSGAFCELERWRLEYESADTGVLRSVVAKRPRDGDIRAVGEALGLYERERAFFEALADRVPLRVPRCFHAGDGDRGSQPLLLEDLCHATPGDQVAGLTIDAARDVLREVAAMHAAFWEAPALSELDFLWEADSPTNVAVLEQVVAAGLPGLQARFAGRIPAATMQRAVDVCGRMGDVLRACAQGPRTLAHGDLRLDNLLFEDGAAIYLDWQTAARARGTHDVAYLLSGSVAADALESEWEALLRDYHATLRAGGVTGYDWEQCLADYRQNVLYSFVPALAVLGSVTVEGEHGEGLADVIGERVLRHADAVGAFESI